VSFKHRRHGVTDALLGKLYSSAEKECVRSYYQAGYVQLTQLGECRVEIRVGPCVNNVKPQSKGLSGRL